MSMNYTMISSLRSIPSVTMFLGMPNDEKENRKYAILLKNMIREVMNELEEKYAKNDYEQIIEQLDKIEQEFQPSRAAGSYVFFVSNEYHEQVKVPFIVESGYQIGSSFTTRKLLRASNSLMHYYVLTLGAEEARLLEYQNEQLIQEYKDQHFPLKNKGYWTSDRLLNSMGSVRSNYQREFYKLIDSELQSYINREPHPIILAGVEANTSLYKQIANRNDLIIGQIHGNFTSDHGESNYVIGKKGQRKIEKYLIEQDRTLLSSLEAYQSKERLEQDLSTIYRLALHGRGQQLVVDEDYYQEAVIENERIDIDNVDAMMPGYTEDVVNEIIYHVMRYGGAVHFTKATQMGEYSPIVLKLRY